jgi:hypothetical protein
MKLTRCTRPDPAARCTWCDSELSRAPDLRIFCVLLGVRDEASLADHLGKFVEYPLLETGRTVAAYVRRVDEPPLSRARTDYNLVLAGCTSECAGTLSRALEADENVVSFEDWTGAASGVGVPRPGSGSFRSITPSTDRTYIILRVVGDYTRDRAMTNTIEAHAMGRELGIRRYLVDMTESRNAESVLANYEFARKEIWDAPEIDKTALVAVLVSPEDHSHDFVETVARNAGLRVTLFRDRARAEQHLRADG